MFLRVWSGFILTGTSLFTLNAELLNAMHHAHVIVAMHSIGSSIFMVYLFLHLLRNIMYRSYIHNSNVFVKGLIIYLLGMVVCFLGYSCNLARMAYWALRVVINMLNFVGAETFCIWFYGGYSVSVEMFPRVFVFHV